MATGESFFSDDNAFGVLNSDQVTEDDQQGWVIHRSKRGRKSTGGQSTDVGFSEYRSLSSDAKLEVQFTEIHENGTKIDSISAKLSECLALKQSVEQLQDSMLSCERRLKYLEYKSLHLNARDRRNNLLFEGFREVKGVKPSELILEMLDRELEIDWPPDILRCYRVGPFNHTKRRAIFAEFASYVDVQFILSRAYMLKGSQYSINRDFPVEIANARKSLWPTFKAIRNKNRDSKVVMGFPAKIIKDGEVILDRFPEWDTILGESSVAQTTGRKQPLVDQTTDRNLVCGYTQPAADPEPMETPHNTPSPAVTTARSSPQTPEASQPVPTGTQRRSRSPVRRQINAPRRLSRSASTHRGRAPTYSTALRDQRHRQGPVNNSASQPEASGQHFSRPWINAPLHDTGSTGYNNVQ